MKTHFSFLALIAVSLLYPDLCFSSDVETFYVDVDGPQRQDEVTFDTTRRAGHLGLITEHASAHVAKSKETYNDLWKDSRSTVDAGDKGEHGEINSVENNDQNNYQEYHGSADLQDFDVRKKVGDSYRLPAHFPGGASQEMEEQSGEHRYLNPQLTIPWDAVQSEDSWQETRDEPRRDATAAIAGEIEKVDKEEPEMKTGRAAATGEMLKEMNDIDTGGANDGAYNERAKGSVGMIKDVAKSPGGGGIGASENHESSSSSPSTNNDSSSNNGDNHSDNNHSNNGENNSNGDITALPKGWESGSALERNGARGIDQVNSSDRKVWKRLAGGGIGKTGKHLYGSLQTRFVVHSGQSQSTNARNARNARIKNGMTGGGRRGLSGVVKNAALMRDETARIAAKRMDKRDGPGACDADAGDDCSDECEIGPWRAVLGLVNSGLVDAATRHARMDPILSKSAMAVLGARGKKIRNRAKREGQILDVLENGAVSKSTYLKKFKTVDDDDRATAIANLNDAVHGRKSRRSKYGGAPGGFTCLSTNLANLIVALAEAFDGSKIVIASLSGGDHPNHESHYRGRAIDIASIAGTPLDKYHPTMAKAVAKVCMESGAVAVANVNLGCGATCDSHADRVHCAFPLEDRNDKAGDDDC